MDNSLQNLYQQVYKNGKDSFFTFPTIDITKEILSSFDFTGKKVLEIGCGTGETAFAVATKTEMDIHAYDFSAEAIKTASKQYNKSNLSYRIGSFDSISEKYDVIILQEVIEHVDDPKRSLQDCKNALNHSGSIIVTCPSFLNVRGIVWMTLQLLFNVPMSLSDRHFLSPQNMKEIAEALNMTLSWRTFRYSQAHGEQMFIDMKKRLTNALRDAGLDNTKVDELLEWLHEICNYENDTEFNGAKAIYILN